MIVYKDETGNRYGNLSVISLSDRKDFRHERYWNCKCDCGSLIVVKGCHLRNGNTKGCGCLRGVKIKHGGANSSEYRIWIAIKSRCLNKNNTAYHHYGGRGIKICSEWQNNFDTFIRHVGKRPTSKHSLDRKDNDGDYEPGNVKWATQYEQSRNKRNNITVNINGIFYSNGRDFCTAVGMKFGFFDYRYYELKMPVHEIYKQFKQQSK